MCCADGAPSVFLVHPSRSSVGFRRYQTRWRWLWWPCGFVTVHLFWQEVFIPVAWFQQFTRQNVLWTPAKLYISFIWRSFLVQAAFDGDVCSWTSTCCLEDFTKNKITGWPDHQINVACVMCVLSNKYHQRFFRFCKTPRGCHSNIPSAGISSSYPEQS